MGARAVSSVDGVSGLVSSVATPSAASVFDSASTLSASYASYSAHPPLLRAETSSSPLVSGTLTNAVPILSVSAGSNPGGGAPTYHPQEALSLEAAPTESIIFVPLPSSAEHHSRHGSSSTESSRSSSSMTMTGSASASASASSSAAPATCNGHAAFCSRRYSDVTVVGAHNSPFVRPHNVAANQARPVLTQLDDGIRLLQLQTHVSYGYGDGGTSRERGGPRTIHMCHTTCALLDAGPLEPYLAEVRGWLDRNRNEVVTMIIVNGDYLPATAFRQSFENSGLSQLAYIPGQQLSNSNSSGSHQSIPQAARNFTRDDWPTLGELISANTRAVVFLDYMANQTAVPYLLEEFTYVFETPYSPTNRDFPCNAQRPPGLNVSEGRQRLYLANHNLNLQLGIGFGGGSSSNQSSNSNSSSSSSSSGSGHDSDHAIAGASLSFLASKSTTGSSSNSSSGSSGSSGLLIPNRALLNATNAAAGPGSLGAMSVSCARLWLRPPTFLLVDFYDYGHPPGSVFAVAAQANNVSYDWSCCHARPGSPAIPGTIALAAAAAGPRPFFGFSSSFGLGFSFDWWSDWGWWSSRRAGSGAGSGSGSWPLITRLDRKLMQKTSHESARGRGTREGSSDNDSNSILRSQAGRGLGSGSGAGANTGAVAGAGIGSLCSLSGDYDHGGGGGGSSSIHGSHHYHRRHHGGSPGGRGHGSGVGRWLVYGLIGGVVCVNVFAELF